MKCGGRVVSTAELVELLGLEEEYQRILDQLNRLQMSLSKELQIRVKEWIKKLSAVIDNIHWRRNRNLYAKVLLGMVRRKIMEHPFNRMPGQGSLPKLTLYEIPYEIRKQVQAGWHDGEGQQQPNKIANQDRGQTKCKNDYVPTGHNKQPLQHRRAHQMSKKQRQSMRDCNNMLQLTTAQHIGNQIIIMLQQSANFLRQNAYLVPDAETVWQLQGQIQDYLQLRSPNASFLCP